MEVAEKTHSSSWKIQLVKVILATMAGFAATKLVETGFDKVVTEHQSETDV